MKNALRNSAAFITTGAVSLSLALPAFAENTANLCPKGGQFNKLCSSNFSLGGIVSFMITLLFVVAVIACLIFLIWGGVKWILSGGDKTKVQASRDQIVAALIGLAVAFAAYFLLNLVVNLFLGTSLNQLNLPSFSNLVNNN
jgi:flagellar biosynthesis protein FlhB